MPIIVHGKARRSLGTYTARHKLLGYTAMYVPSSLNCRKLWIERWRESEEKKNIQVSYTDDDIAAKKI